MSLRRRLFRIFFTILVVLLFAGYFAFSTLFFSPLEGDYEFPLAALVPRDVDFLLAKTDLAGDFSECPRLAAADAFRDSRAGRELLESPEWQRFLTENGITEGLAQLERALDQAPVAVDPLALFGGREVLVAGYFKGKDLAAADFVVMGRANWMGKLGQSLLAFPGLIGLEDQGLAVMEEGGVTMLSGGQLSRPLHIARIADVLIAGTSQPLVTQALELEANKGQDSFALSARYADYIQNQEHREPEDFELFVDQDALMKNLGFDGKFPNQSSPDFTQAFLARLFQVGLLKEVEGVVGFNGGLSVDLHAELSSEKLSSAQKRFYREPGFNRDRMFEVGRYAPSDTGILAYMQADVGDVLRMALASTEAALQANFDDSVRAVWGFPDGSALIDQLDAGLKDRLALVVRVNDYPDEGLAGPPHDDQPTLAWALVGWAKDKQLLDDFRQKVIANQGRFGIQGRESGSAGVFTNEVAGGLVVYEYWSPLVPGTGHLSSVVSDDVFIVGNHHQLVADILLTSLGDPSYPALEKGAAFSSLVSLGLGSTSAFLWFDPSSISEPLHLMADRAARDAVGINWDLERPRLDALVRKRDFGNRSAEELDPDEYSRYETALEDELTRFEAQYFGENVAGLASTFNRYVTYLDEVRGLLFQLSLDPKRVDVSMRALIPLEPER